MLPRLVLNLLCKDDHRPSSCLHLPCAEIISMRHCTRLFLLAFSFFKLKILEPGSGVAQMLGAC